MGHIDTKALVRAEQAKVYAYLSDPRNAPHYIGAIKRVGGGPDGRPKAGDSYQAAAEFMGRPAQITLRLQELLPDRRVVMTLQGDPAASIQIELRPADGGRSTEVRARLDVPSAPSLMLELVMGRMLRDGIATLAGTLGDR